MNMYLHQKEIPDKIKSYIVTFLSLLICSCFGCNSEKNQQNNLFVYQTEPKKVKLDKQDISQAFIDNVEYFRRFIDYTGYSADSIEIKHPNSQWDPANFFVPYASRYSLVKDSYINSPLPTQSQMTVTVDTIIYNNDGLFCVALLCLNLHYDIIKGVEDMRDLGREYSAKAIIGYRDNINKPFKIYPLDTFIVTGFEDCRSAISCIKKMFFNQLQGASLPMIYKTGDYEYNLNDPRFFDSVLFEKDVYKEGFYNFQLYRYMGNVFEYQYYSNQSDSIKAKWVKGN